MIVFDESPEPGARAPILFPTLMGAAVVTSIADLRLAVAHGTSRDTILANVPNELLARQLALCLRRAAFPGHVLAVVPDVDDRTATTVGALPRTRCIARDAREGLTDDLLRRAIDRKPGGAPEGRTGSAAVPTEAPSGLYGLVGRSKSMLQILAHIRKVAAGDANVCIYGESGTGKEMVSRAIHQASRRRSQPFVTLDCTTVPDGLMESHLFGHVKGAFTGAVGHHDGVFSRAHTGTLFIDELTELPFPLQAKLLRVIQMREFVKVGGTKPLRTNVRLITAMNKDPRGAVESGTFREDLYYRIGVVMLRIPPLRERREDIPLLVNHFLRRFASIYEKPITAVSPEALDRMIQLPWPGNIRQLANFVEQAFVLADAEVLTEADLFPPGTADLHIEAAGLTLREVERRHILRMLQATGGNRTQAAKALGISVRTLQYKLKTFANIEDQTVGARLPLPPGRIRRALNVRTGT